MIRHLRDHLHGDEPTLALISIDSMRSAAPALGRCALDLASENKDVLVIDLSEKRAVARLFGRRVRVGQTVVLNYGVGSVHIYSPGRDGRVDGPLPIVSATLLLAELDPVRGAEHVARWANQAVVVVTTGRSGPDKIRANAEMLRAAGIELASAVVVDVDHDDFTLGRDAGVEAAAVPDAPAAAAPDERAPNLSMASGGARRRS